MRWVSQERSFVMRWLSRKGLQYTKKFLLRDCMTLKSSPYLDVVGWGKSMGDAEGVQKVNYLFRNHLAWYCEESRTG